MTRDPAEGVGPDGTITTGVSADRVPVGYTGVLADSAARLRTGFGDRLHGRYLYGSVATGQARPLESDLDLLAVWKSPVDSAAVATVLDELSARHRTVVREVGLAQATLAEVTADDRDGFGLRCFLRHYCVWLAGEDLRPTLPACRPSAAVASVGGDADLPRCGQIGQSFPDREVAGVVDRGLGAERPAFLVVLLDRGVLVVDVQARGDRVGDHSGA